MSRLYNQQQQQQAQPVCEDTASVPTTETEQDEDSCDRFLQFHDSIRKSGKFYDFDRGSEDYRLYISAITGRPRAAERVFHYCVRTDDAELVLRLFNHLGGQYIFTHFSTLYEPILGHEMGDQKPLFWVAALYGSERYYIMDSSYYI